MLQAPSVLGQATLEIPDSAGISRIGLITHCLEDNTLCHCLSHIDTLDQRYRQVELLKVNDITVKGRCHTEVVCSLRQQLSIKKTIMELKMVVMATDVCGRKHLLELTFDILSEDSHSLGDKVRTVYDVIVTLVDTIVTSPDVTDVHYQTCRKIHIRHGALEGYFMKVNKDYTMSMDIGGNDDEERMFECFEFFGHDQKERSASFASQWPQLCVLREPRSGRYIDAGVLSPRLTANQYSKLQTNISSILKPDARFFVIYHPKGDTSRVILATLSRKNYYLRFDVVKGLVLKKCDILPYDNRAFYFEFVP